MLNKKTALGRPFRCLKVTALFLAGLFLGRSFRLGCRLFALDRHFLGLGRCLLLDHDFLPVVRALA